MFELSFFNQSQHKHIQQVVPSIKLTKKKNQFYILKAWYYISKLVHKSYYYDEVDANKSFDFILVPYSWEDFYFVLKMWQSLKGGILHQSWSFPNPKLVVLVSKLDLVGFREASPL